MLLPGLTDGMNPEQGSGLRCAAEVYFPRITRLSVELRVEKRRQLVVVGKELRPQCRIVETYLPAAAISANSSAVNLADRSALEHGMGRDRLGFVKTRGTVGHHELEIKRDFAYRYDPGELAGRCFQSCTGFPQNRSCGLRGSLLV